jgi:hypothetical protein
MMPGVGQGAQLPRLRTAVDRRTRGTVTRTTFTAIGTISSRPQVGGYRSTVIDPAFPPELADVVERADSDYVGPERGVRTTHQESGR